MPKLKLGLASILMAFPQTVETIYSPALPHIAYRFAVTPELASLTLSCYFLAFALGVAFWGRVSDRVGRRPAILCGLLVYGVACGVALITHIFPILLGARIMAAFGAAAASIVTQTAVRDSYSGKELGKVFSLIGIALSLSPALGMGLGAGLVYFWASQGVFSGLFVLAFILGLWCFLSFSETRPMHLAIPPTGSTFVMMLRDKNVWYNAICVALFNICLFSYYQLAPFHFELLGFSPAYIGYTGLILAVGAGVGAIASKTLVGWGWPPLKIILAAALLLMVGSCLVMALHDSWMFIGPMALVLIGYGMAIPNILATALQHYSDRLGTAGALFGLLYYTLLGGGLLLTGYSQNLGGVLVVCSAFIVGLVLLRYRQQRYAVPYSSAF